MSARNTDGLIEALERASQPPQVDPPAEVRPTVLEEAESIVNGPRRESYGPPAVNHGRTAVLWGAYLGIELAARDVCMLNALQKIGRDAHIPTRDNLVDIAGYMRNAELMDEGDA